MICLKVVGIITESMERSQKKKLICKISIIICNLTHNLENWYLLGSLEILVVEANNIRRTDGQKDTDEMSNHLIKFYTNYPTNSHL